MTTIGFRPLGERLAQHEPRLRQRALGGVDEQEAAVGHRQHALDLAAEVGVAGRVDQVDLGIVGQPERDVLGQDRDAAFPLQRLESRMQLSWAQLRCRGTGRTA